MPLFTILFGIALMIVGIGTYAASNDKPSALLLPIIFGLVGLGLGVAAVIKQDLRKNLMHGAVLLASLGVLVPIIQLIVRVVDMWQEERDRSLTLLAVILTVVISGAYVFTAVQSFRAARRARQDPPRPPARTTPPPAEPKPEPPASDPTPPA